MYDMTRGMANGYFDEGTSSEELKANRQKARAQIAAERTIDYKNGTYAMAESVPAKVTPDMPLFSPTVLSLFSCIHQFSLCQRLQNPLILLQSY